MSHLVGKHLLGGGRKIQENVALGSFGKESQYAQKITRNRLEEQDSLEGRCRKQVFDPGIKVVTIPHLS